MEPPFSVCSTLSVFSVFSCSHFKSVTVNRLSETRLSHHNFQIFNVKHLEKVLPNVRQIFMSATMKAAVHLPQDYEENLRTTKNTYFEHVKTLFDVSQSFILNHKSEIHRISTIEWNTTPWMRSTLLQAHIQKPFWLNVFGSSVS